MPLKAIDPTRIEFHHSISPAEIAALASDRNVRVLQCSKPQPGAAWDLLNDAFFSKRPDVQLRVYGFYGKECDLAFLSGMSNVRRFSADCIMAAIGIECVVNLRGLQSLGIGIYNLQSFEFLRELPGTLDTLSLGATRSKKPDLSPLARFQGLREVYLERQHKNIEVISRLPNLRTLTLRSITTPDLACLAPLTKLAFLDIKLGGIRNLSHLGGNAGIQYLELWQIAGLEEIDVLGRMPALQNLLLVNLPRIRSLPDLRGARSLRRFVIENLKGLRDFSSLEFAPALEEFLLVQGDRQKEDDLLPVLRNPKLRRMSAFFGSETRNAKFVEIRNARGIGEFTPHEFRYQ